MGIAYAFFDCKASPESIKAELPTLRDRIGTPSELELTLIEGTTKLRGDMHLWAIAKQADDAGIRYVLRGKHPQTTNEDTAGELAAILNQAYNSPLYQNGEEFRGEIVYNEGNTYIYRD